MLQDGVESGQVRVSELGDADVALGRAADVTLAVTFGQKLDELVRQLVNLLSLVFRELDADGSVVFLRKRVKTLWSK